MNKLCLALVVLCGACSVAIGESPTNPPTPSPNNYGPQFDEVVVDTNLNVRKKTSPQIRTQRSVESPTLIPAEPIVYKLIKNIRVKRQFRPQFRPQRPFYGSSQSAANANANSQYFGQNGFGSSAANAQAQGFQANSPFGNFGASAANTNTQAFQAGPNGINGAAGVSGSQTYNLPNGQNVNIAYANGYSLANGVPTYNNGRPTVTYTQG